MSILRFAIVSIPVTDQVRSKAFYSETLGFEVLADDPMGPEQRWVQLRPPGAETSITLVHWFDDMPAGCLRGMVLDVEDLEATYQDLQSKSVELSEVQSAPWGRFATFSDPDGNGWILQETPQ